MNSILNFVFLKNEHTFNGEPNYSMEGPLFYYIQKKGYSYTLNGELKSGYKNLLLIEGVHKLASISDIPDFIYKFVLHNNVKLLFANISDPCNFPSYKLGIEYISKKLPKNKYYIIDSTSRLGKEIYSYDWFLEESIRDYEIYGMEERNDLGYVSSLCNVEEIDTFRNKKFLCLNRGVDKSHRLSLLKEYLTGNYNDSYFSFLLKIEGYAKIYGIGLNYDVDYYNNFIPIELDTQNRIEKNNFRVNNINKKELYLDSCINLVTETSFEQNELFISEKIVRPIINYQPFILFGPYGYLNKLKSYGFKTFSDFWDESYDEIKNPEVRFFKLLELVRFLNNLSIKELNNLYQKTKNICIYNKQLFHSLKTDTTDTILKQIENEW